MNNSYEAQMSPMRMFLRRRRAEKQRSQERAARLEPGDSLLSFDFQSFGF